MSKVKGTSKTLNPMMAADLGDPRSSLDEQLSPRDPSSPTAIEEEPNLDDRYVNTHTLKARRRQYMVNWTSAKDKAIADKNLAVGTGMVRAPAEIPCPA